MTAKSEELQEFRDRMDNYAPLYKVAKLEETF